MDRNDREVSDILASPTECLPTKEQEAEAESLRRDTPLSLQIEEMEEDKENIFDQIYPYDTVETSIDIAFPTLVDAFPEEDFSSMVYQKYVLHKYLSSQMKRMEFFIANNQWGTEFISYPMNRPIRMRVGVKTRQHKKEHRVYHKECKPNVNVNGGFTSAILTVEASNVEEFLHNIIENANLFFCKSCEHYIFDNVCYFNDKQFALPDEDTWPKCKHVLFDNTNICLMAHQLIGIVSVFSEPPRKKVCRRLNFDE